MELDSVNNIKNLTNNYKNYKYGIHPLLKLSGLIFLNIIAFTTFFKFIKLYILVIELFLGFLIKIPIRRIKGLLKILMINFISLYFLFYFINFNFLDAFFIFIDYALMILIMLLATFIFYHITPPYELLIALKKLRVSTKFAVAITISLGFFPIMTQIIRQILAFQRARGYKIRLWNIGPLLIPIFLAILDLSINLSLSLDSRGFNKS